MRRDDVLAILAAHKDELARFHVKSLALFGSVARDEAGPESDVDVLVEFDPPVGLFGFVRLQLFLEALFGHPVDLVERAAVRPAIRERVLNEAVRAA
jgi:predicted nucleotidyltransferase